MAQQANTPSEGRLYFLDKVKAFIIFCVVVYHAGWVYEGSGLLSAFWIVDDPSKNQVAGLVNLMLDMFMMPVMFFISGYFAPVTLRARKGWAFIISRFKRLMLPWILAVLILIPLSNVVFLASRGLPQGDLDSYFHFTGGIPMNQGWLWFLPVLFMFDVVFFLFSQARPAGISIGMKPAVVLIFLLGFIQSFFMSFYGHSGWFKTMLLDLQKERLIIYALMFLLGAISFKNGVFTTAPTGKKLYYALCATIWIPMNLYIVFLVNMFMRPGVYFISRPIDLVVLWLGFHLSMLGMLYLLINTFRYYLNKKRKISSALGRYSYGVYILHYVVMGVIALVLLDMDMSSTVKYAILGVITFIASNLILFFYKEAVQKLWQSSVSVGRESAVLSGQS